MEEFNCRYNDFLTCGKPIFRKNMGDLFDYPYCEECQVKDCLCLECRKILANETVTRLDDGRHT